MGEIYLAMNDTARHAKHAADTLPHISGSVANIQRDVEILLDFTVRRAEQRNKTFGHHHPDTLWNQHEMRWILYCQKRYAESEAIFRDLIE
jgi:hypothetical protein